MSNDTERIRQLEATLNAVREWCDEVDLSIKGPYYLGDRREVLNILNRTIWENNVTGK